MVEKSLNKERNIYFKRKKKKHPNKSHFYNPIETPLSF